MAIASSTTSMNIVYSFLRDNNFIVFILEKDSPELDYGDKTKDWYPRSFDEENTFLAFSTFSYELWLVKYDPTLNLQILSYANAVDNIWIVTNFTDHEKMDEEQKSSRMQNLSEYGVGLIATINSDDELEPEKKFTISPIALSRYVDPVIRRAIFKAFPKLRAIANNRVIQPYYAKNYENIDPPAKPDILNELYNVSDLSNQLIGDKLPKGSLPFNESTKNEQSHLELHTTEDIQRLMDWGKRATRVEPNNPMHVADILSIRNEIEPYINQIREEIDKLTKNEITLDDCKTLIMTANKFFPGETL